MAYEVIARKWRPQQFDDVVGQEHVTRTLRNAIDADRLAHAYLFVGPRGTGKTSLARIFAKTLNCGKRKGHKPCDKCDSCIEIMEGRSLDVQEIDGASNNGVDQVRDLRDAVKYAPARGPYRIYVIDEVHMLSMGAFNALLKTIEEPPRHVKFIFATTEADKVPATILSRCQRFDLRRISLPLIVERLKLIADKEGFEVTSDALLAVARGAEGGLRDAESALDQLVSFCGRKIEEQDVLSVFGLVSRRVVTGLAGQVLSGDIPGLIRTVKDMDEAGKDMQRLLIELLGCFRDLLVCRYIEGDTAELGIMAEDREALMEQSGEVSPARIVRVAEILSEAEEGMRTALSRRTMLEMALIRSARAARSVSLDEVLAKVQALREELGGAGEGTAPQSAAPVRFASSPSRPQAVREPELPMAGAAPTGLEPSAEAAAAGTGERECRLLRQRWGDVAAAAAMCAVSLRNALADAAPISVSGDTVTIGFDREFAEEPARFDVPRNRLALEKAISDVLGRCVKLSFVLKDEAEIEAACGEAGGARADDGKRPSEGARESKKTPQEWARDPAVKRVAEMFDGTVSEVRGI